MRASGRRHGAILLAALLMLSLVAGCGPEASRTRGGGQGADPGNYPSAGRDAAQLHGTTTGPPQIYFNTPNRVVPSDAGLSVK